MILITGASGFIGAQLRTLLERAGTPVLAVDRQPSPGLGATQAGDIGDVAFVEEVFREHPIRGWFISPPC